MANHPSFGVVPEKAFREAEAAPYGQATDIIRRYDPLFGMLKAEANQKIKTFTANVRRRKYVDETATVNVLGVDSKQAEHILDRMDWESFDWQEDVYSEDTQDYDLVSMAEKQG